MAQIPHILDHKQGASFQLSVSFLNDDKTPVDITGITITSQIRTDRYVLVQSLFVEKDSDPTTGKYSLKSLDTSTWPAGNLFMDIKYADATSNVFLTDTIQIRVERNITA